MQAMTGRKRGLAALLCLGILGGLLLACDDPYTVDMYLSDFLDSQPSSSRSANESADTGDDEVDGILAASETVVKITEADEKVQEGLWAYDRGDVALAASKMDEAIGERPDDPTYRRMRARVALGANDGSEARLQWQEQDRIAEMNGWTEGADYWRHCYVDCLNMEREMTRQIPDSPADCSPQERQRAIALYNRMIDVVEQLNAAYTREDPDFLELEMGLEWYQEKLRSYGG
jgi:hypothetical protein